MGLKINTLKKRLGTLLVAIGLLFAISVSAQAQRRRWEYERRHDRPNGVFVYGGWNARNELRRDRWREREYDRFRFQRRWEYRNNDNWRWQRRERRNDWRWRY